MSPHYSSVVLRFFVQLAIFIIISVVGFYLCDWLISRFLPNHHWATFARLIAGCIIFTYALSFNQKLCYAKMSRRQREDAK
ncbi:hypothetical protein BFC20_04190 [Brochothrix thermosphacta]|uniref:hypothetical protein n=1 Tax=Brochothrix thermosphacta TaxID=2756 RepID=UPI000E7498D7|nr:hypothetical protein [Brochothrix thermosphacta]ANZ96969.1 hypothetical protein BFC20_04190 [Brochothrix thermosphacta]